MAPKKNENKTALVLKIPKEKVTKGRKKKDSPKSKKRVIRVKFPLKNLKNDGKKKNIIDDAKKMLTFDRMNEVARAQLVKKSPVETLVESASKPVVKKKGCKKKIQDPESDLVVPKKKLKGPAKDAKVEKKVVKKSKAAVPPEKNPIKRKRGRPPIRGKPKADDDSTITSPSILSQGPPECKTPVKVSQKPISKSPAGPCQNSDSRRTSVTSGSGWSWTKDMSGSSTTTCITVYSTDLVRIDGKLPEIKLNKITMPDHIPIKEPQENMCEKKEGEHSLSEDSSSTSSSSSSSSSSDSNTVHNGLNLSTSSISPVPHSPTYTAVNHSFDKSYKPNINKVSATIEMLAPKLKSFDLSFPDIDNESESILDMKPFEEKVFKILEEEYNAILECNFLNQLLSEKCVISKRNAPETQDKPVEEPEFAKPDLTVISNKSFCDNRDSHNDLSYDSARRRDAYDDDDDALSLFAESLTGMDSRLSSSASVAYAPPIHEEYVPQPLGKKPSMAANYQPTRIDKNDAEAAITKPVCEKQNADSTSIHKEQEVDAALKAAPVNRPVPGHIQQSAGNVVDNQPQLTISSYKSPYKSKSMTLSGVCFFNLTTKCKNKACRFSHFIIDDADLSKRLAQLSEKHFFQEYMLIAKWPVLKRKYIRCFVNECQRRELPKILVEIVINFLSNAHPNSSEDSAIKVDIIESTLMYLNSWDLEVCEKLLTYKIGDKVLCEVFMEIIGKTQNFSRFKNVFINLAGFMVRENRTFDFDVVTHILERVCILPFEAPLSAVLVAIMGKTDRKIFDNRMMEIFEMQISSCNKGLYEALLRIKQNSGTSNEPVPVIELFPPVLPSPCGSKELEPLAKNLNGGLDQEQRYTSPDTTNTDNANKPATDPVFIRTINHLARPPNMSKPAPSPTAQGPFPRDWNQRSILNQIPRMPQKRPGRPLERPQFKFQRRYGPDFYGNH